MSTLLRRLPPLDLVRGFVAVGRRMSITLAAEDLCLTQSAVSRQVQALEEALGERLLVRGYRSIAFTAEGERFFRAADAALAQLQDAVATLKAPRERAPVTVTASIGVAALWLLPRLGRFQERHPTIDVRVAASNRVLGLRADNIDLAIRYCSAAQAPAGSVRLFGETIVPVAHPSLAGARFDTADALAGQVLIEYDDPARPWLQWADRLASLGLGQARPKQVLRFNQYDQVVQAAVAAHGIALGRLPLIRPLLAEGRLVALAPEAALPEHAHGYWLVQAEARARTDVRAVAGWIREEAARAGSPAAVQGG